MLRDYISQLRSMIDRYDSMEIYGEEINTLQKNFGEFKLPVVLIGEFSAGKSSLINALLGHNLLEVDITPTTAQPTIIHYSDENYRRKEGELTFIGINHPEMEKLKNILLVDLPGITSGNLNHVSVVKKFLEDRKGVVIVVVDVSKGTVLKEVLDFLKDIGEFGTEYSIILNKTDLITDEEVEKVSEKLQQSFEKYAGTKPIFVEKTSVLYMEIEGFRKILNHYNEHFDNIRDRIFAPEFLHIAGRFRSSLQTLQKALENQYSMEKEKLEEGIRELEDAIKTLEEEKDFRISRLEQEILSFYRELTSDLRDYIMSQWNLYIGNEERFREDVEEFLKSRNEEIVARIENSVQAAIREMQDQLLSSQRMSELFRFMGSIMPESAAKNVEGLPASIAAGAGIGAGLVRFAGALFSRLGFARLAAFLSNPIAIFGGAILGALFGMKVEEDQTSKMRLQVLSAVENVNKRIMSHAESVYRELSQKVIEEYFRELKRRRDEIKAYREALYRKEEERRQKLTEIENDLKALDLMIERVKELTA